MALHFNGITHYLNCGTGTTLDNIWHAGGTFAAWITIDVLPSDGGTDTIAHKTATVNDFWSLEIWNSAGAGTSDNVLYFKYGFATTNGSWQCADEALTSKVGVWTHVAVTYNSSSGTNDPVFYVNGAVSATTKLTTPDGAEGSDAAANLVLAFKAGYFDGKMEDVRTYNRILSANEVAILAAGYRGPLGSEVGWWPMDDARDAYMWDGMRMNSRAMPDRSGYGNNGSVSAGGDVYGENV